MLDIDGPYRGDERVIRGFLRARRQPFCVYLLSDPDGVPFYVGEGGLDRPFFHVTEARRGHDLIETNIRKCRKIRKIEAVGGVVRYEIDSLHETKAEAIMREGDLITRLGRREEGGPLLNLQPGYGNPAGSSPESLERHAASLSGKARDPETAELNDYFSSLWSVGSTPIKPFRKWRRNARITTGKTKSNNLSFRSASAIVAALHGHGLKLEPGVVVPRLFECRDIPAIVENGVSEDLCGLKHVELIRSEIPWEEAYRIPDRLPGKIVGLVGRPALERAGIMY